MEWILAHQGELLAALGSLWGLVTIIVGLTPSTKDDNVVRRIAERFAFLKPSNTDGSPLSLPGAKAPPVKSETFTIEHNAPTSERDLGRGEK